MARIKTFPGLRTWILALRSAYPDLDTLADSIVKAASDLKNTADPNQQAGIVSGIGDQIVQQLGQLGSFFPPVTALPPYNQAMQAAQFWANQPEDWLSSTAGKPGVIMMTASNLITNLISAMAGANMKLSQDASSMIDAALAPVLGIMSQRSHWDFEKASIDKLKNTWQLLTNRFNFGDASKFPRLAKTIEKINSAFEQLDQLSARDWQYWREYYGGSSGYSSRNSLADIRYRQRLEDKARNSNVKQMMSLMKSIVKAILDLKNRIDKYDYDLTGAADNGEISNDGDFDPEITDADPDVEADLNDADDQFEKEYEVADEQDPTGEAKAYRAYVKSMRPWGIRSTRITAKLFLLAYRAYKSDQLPKMLQELTGIKKDILSTSEDITGQDWEKKYGNWSAVGPDYNTPRDQRVEPDPEWVETADTYDIAKHIRDVLGYDFWDIMGNDFKENVLDDAKTALESANLAIMQGIADYKKGISTFRGGKPSDGADILKQQGDNMAKIGLGPAADAMDAAINGLKNGYDPYSNKQTRNDYDDPRDDEKPTGEQDYRGRDKYGPDDFGSGQSLQDKGRTNPNRRSISVPASVRQYMIPEPDFDL